MGSAGRISVCSLFWGLTGCAAGHLTERAGSYLGESADDIPKIFAPGFISTGLKERDASLAPDEGCFAFTLPGAGVAVIVLVERTEERWSRPKIAPFSGTFPDIEPAFDPRGERLWFASQRPVQKDGPVADWNLWFVPYERSSMGLQWGEPQPVAEVNESGHEFYPSVSLDGELAFTATRDGGFGGEDIWLASETEHGWTLRNAGGGVNTPGPEFNACLSPDGEALVFSSVREGDRGRGDLYISERLPDGQFGPARALENLNSPYLDYCPSFDASHEVFWFTSNRRMDQRSDKDGEKLWESLDAVRRALESPGNGEDDIYWVRASALWD